MNSTSTTSYRNDSHACRLILVLYKMFTCALYYIQRAQWSTVLCPLLVSNTSGLQHLGIKRESEGESLRERSLNSTSKSRVSKHWSGNRKRHPWHCFLADYTWFKRHAHTQRLILTWCDFDSASQLFSQKEHIIIYHEKYYCERGLGSLSVN